ncbi:MULTISPECIES: hypothetical protein [Myxococcus]|nr:MULTISPECIES: hypothetical protein [Myxococcus]NTX05192.1 hypothetical protein [Myxococcus sp. CA040A]NTX39754.1 hypothetical protein [Myxococcus sp. CA033]NTX53722.1 hypothetical protein [Myxococcus sp. CA039A]
MSRASSLVIRVPALLFSVAVVGSLIGFAWEGAVYGRRDATEEWAPPPSLDDAPPAKPAGRSPEEEAALKRALVHFPAYPRASRAELLAVDYLGPDVPIAVAWFSTKDTPEQVLSHYRQVLLDNGLPVLGERHGEHGGWVGYWSPATEEMRLVSVLAQGGETLGFVSAGQVAPLLKRASRVPPWIPLPPELGQPVTLSFSMEGASHHVVSGQLPEGSPTSVGERYRSLLTQQGWDVGAVEPVDANGIAFELMKGTTLGRATLRTRAEAPGVELQVSLLQRGAAP